jgi:Amino acid transporters
MKKQTENQRRYGLLTTITMIVGIVIGSGIFFKTDDILMNTGGSVWLGILVFSIAALSIIFGSLTISNLAMLTDKTGGAMAYAEEFVGKKFGCAFGWFQVFMYMPTLTVVLCWVLGIYFCQLFNIEAGLGGQIGFGLIWFFICIFYNIISPRLGGVFQNATTFVKLIPLIVVAVTGLIFGDPAHTLTVAGVGGSSIGWIAAIGPIAFSFDGWIFATTISHEVKNAKRNVPLALVVGPTFVLVCYLLYFIGVSAYLGPDVVMELGDASAAEMGRQIFGSFGAKVLLTFVVISIMGTINGVVMGTIRLPYALASRGMLPFSKWVSKMNDKYQMSVNSGIFAMVVCGIWWVIHYFTMRFGLLGNSDISEISIVMCYVLFMVLYFKVFMLWREGKIKGNVRGSIFPILATAGSVFIIYGGLQNPYFFIFVGICFVVFLLGYFFKPCKDVHCNE